MSGERFSAPSPQAFSEVAVASAAGPLPSPSQAGFGALGPAELLVALPVVAQGWPCIGCFPWILPGPWRVFWVSICVPLSPQGWGITTMGPWFSVPQTSRGCWIQPLEGGESSPVGARG